MKRLGDNSLINEVMGLVRTAKEQRTNPNNDIAQRRFYSACKSYEDMIRILNEPDYPLQMSFLLGQPLDFDYEILLNTVTPRFRCSKSTKRFRVGNPF